MSDEEIERRLDTAGPSGFDPVPFLERVRIPMLWLYGEADRSMPVDRSVALLERLSWERGKDLTIEVFDGLGHDLTHDREAVGTLVAWLAERSG